MEYLILILLSLSLSLDDFGLAFALSLLMPGKNIKKQIFNAGKIAFAFSLSTAFLPLLGWLVGLAIYEWVAPFSDWIVLIVFCGVGVWTIKEAFEEERYPILKKSLPSFWMLLAIGVFASLDEGAVGLGYPFLGIPITWIIVAVILTNTILIFIAVFSSSLMRSIEEKYLRIISGIIFISLGILNFLELTF